MQVVEEIGEEGYPKNVGVLKGTAATVLLEQERQERPISKTGGRKSPRLETKRNIGTKRSGEGVGRSVIQREGKSEGVTGHRIWLRESKGG